MSVVPRTSPRPGRLLAAATALTLALTLGASVAPAQANGIDTTSRQAVTSAYLTRYKPARATPIPETGTVLDRCVTGTESAAVRNATLSTVNFYRGMGGLDPVTFDAGLSAKAQKSALYMLANGYLTHHPSGGNCFSTDVYDAANNGNLTLFMGSGLRPAPGLYAGAAGPAAIDNYMVDEAANNHLVGHRRWVMHPGTRLMGTGSVHVAGTGSSNTLVVMGEGTEAPVGGFANPAWVAWPTAGFFPQQLLPEPRWVQEDVSGPRMSLTADRAFGVDFSQARVTVTGPGGAPLPLTQRPASPGMGNDTLVWDLHAPLPVIKDTAVHDYKVAVTGIGGDGVPGSHSYTIKVFNPDWDQPGRFTDVLGGNQFFTEIEWLAREGISTGWDVGSGRREYRPLQPVARDAMIAFLYRWWNADALEPYVPPTRSPFIDVPTNSQFYKEIAWAYEYGFTTGWSTPKGREFRPLASVNRDAMAAFLFRATRNVTYTPPARSPFRDITPTTQFYKEMAWMHQAGISTGWPDGTYRPWQPVARDAMAAFLFRFDSAFWDWYDTCPGCGEWMRSATDRRPQRHMVTAGGVPARITP